MLIRKLYLFIYYVMLCVTTTKSEGKSEKKADKDNTLILTMSPEEVINTVRNLVSSPYIRKLANEFAVRAAEHIMSEIKNKQQTKRLEVTTVREVREYTTRKPKTLAAASKQFKLDQRHRPEDVIERHNEMLNDEEASWLLQAPLPDGDNLDLISNLSEEVKPKMKIPVIGVMKINGAYFRRLLELLNDRRHSRLLDVIDT